MLNRHINQINAEKSKANYKFCGPTGARQRQIWSGFGNFFLFFCLTELFRSLVASDILLVLTDINHSVQLFDLHCTECS
jgi:hypothetical protein